jgi:accessory gene regulator B
VWKKTTGWLFEVQKRNGILEEKDRRLYEYAYGVLLGRVAIYLITVILGIATGNWLEMLVFLLPFTVLRQYAGGIHLEKAGSCMIVSSILVLLCSQYLASDLIVTWQMRIIWLHICYGTGGCQQQETGCEREESLWDAREGNFSD